MRFLVTGGAGFIGSHVTDTLVAEGHTVAVVDDMSTGRPANLAPALSSGRVELLEASVDSPKAHRWVTDFAPDVLMLLGAQPSVKISMTNPLLDARTNVMGLITMLDAAVAAGSRKVVFASSGGTIYGNVPPDTLPVPESYEGRPDSFYGITKKAAIDYLRVYGQQHGLEWVALALGNVFGPRQDPMGEAGVVAIFLERLRQALPCVINGSGDTTRDFVHVRDVARAFVRAAERGSGLINIGTGRETSVREVHAALAGYFPAAEPARHGPPLPGEVARISLDSARAREQLGWQAAMSFEDGVEDLVRHVGDKDGARW